ncbi:hypothetical protein [Halomicrobium salinisoli]|uniref:hypothetical protein n=1 Tax=Halomicrobium salinisoli TaxID=2878391 RepID=UPI001CF04B27|nr:hypothetical protein [Halomicrobium salinisoli]
MPSNGNDRQRRTEAPHGIVPPSRFERGGTKALAHEFALSDPAISLPGRTPGEDSFDASSNDPDRGDVGYSFSAGYESQAATRIGDEETRDDKAEKLRKYHEGRHQSDGEHSAREAERDKKRVSQAICSTLPLAKHEREAVVNAVSNLDLDRFGNQKAIAKVTLGVVVVLVDEQHRADADDIDQCVSFSDEFRDVRDTHGVSMSDLSTIKRIAREQLEEQSVSTMPATKRRDPALPGPRGPRDLPRQFWDALPATEWVRIAQNWDDQPEAYKDSIPDDYRETIGLLRKWEPWERS